MINSFSPKQLKSQLFCAHLFVWLFVYKERAFSLSRWKFLSDRILHPIEATPMMSDKKEAVDSIRGNRICNRWSHAWLMKLHYCDVYATTIIFQSYVIMGITYYLVHFALPKVWRAPVSGSVFHPYIYLSRLIPLIMLDPVFTQWVISNRSCLSISLSLCPSVCLEISQRPLISFGPRVYPKGSLVIALVRPSVCPCVRL